MRFSLFSVVQSGTSVHPRILGAGAVDLGAMGIAMDRPDMWAYHAFDGVVGLRGVLAVGSTTSPKLHLILERHDETYVHLHSLDVSSEVRCIDQQISPL